MATTPVSSRPTSRRQRGRESAVSEIKRAALDELRQHGARGVTMRGVARAIEMTPSGLYRYFDDHGSLLAALCVDAHDSLRAALVRAESAHPDDDMSTRWFRGSLVMRDWALEHIDEYSLVVGPRLAGVDPRHPDVTGAVERLMGVPFRTVERAIRNGDLVPRPVALTGNAVQDGGHPVPVEALVIAVAAVSALVGAVSLEAFGSLLGADGEAAYSTYSHQVMRSMGFTSVPEVRNVARVAS